MLKALLQGKPFGHPLHPALVHFPIGLFLLTLILDFAAIFLLDLGHFYRGTRYTLGIGVGMGLLAAAAGFVDRADIRNDHPARKIANRHMVLNLAAVVLLGINFALRLLNPGMQSPSLLQVGLSLLGVGMVMISGYLGGIMVNDDGIGAGRHRRYTPTPEQTIHVSANGVSDGWAPVALADSLLDGGTLRVNFNGDVLVIARLGNEYYAFQEFCTHRYGPLSEGSFHDHQVECPWHRSRFDITNGKVTQGPAKVNLNVYRVAVREGMIALKAKSTR